MARTHTNTTYQVISKQILAKRVDTLGSPDIYQTCLSITACLHCNAVR